jgi:hypothetical protein
MKLIPPTQEEYATFYAGYIEFATKRGDVFAAMSQQLDEMKSALGKLSDKQARFRNAPEEWSIKEIISHLTDGERVFSYRMLRISRNDKTPLPGFEQNDYVKESGADELALEDLLNEFELLRRANVLAVKNLSEEATQRIGAASNFSISVRALIYIMVGHIDHHMASLHEKYLPFV